MSSLLLGPGTSVLSATDGIVHPFVRPQDALRAIRAMMCFAVILSDRAAGIARAAR